MATKRAWTFFDGAGDGAESEKEKRKKEGQKSKNRFSAAAARTDNRLTDRFRPSATVDPVIKKSPVCRSLLASYLPYLAIVLR